LNGTGGATNSGNNSDDGGFEDVEATQKSSAENGTLAKQFEEDEKMAKQIQREMNSSNGHGSNGNGNNGNGNMAVAAPAPPAPKPAPVAAALPTTKKPESPAYEKKSSIDSLAR
jgi:hypothetical protein